LSREPVALLLVVCCIPSPSGLAVARDATELTGCQ